MTKILEEVRKLAHQHILFLGIDTLKLDQLKVKY